MTGSGRAQKNKAHKTRFASKSSRRDHKLGVKKQGEKISKKNVAIQQTAKDLRIQRSKNIRDHKRALLLAEKRGIKGEKSPPRILALIPLSSRVQTGTLRQRILSATDDSYVDSMEMETSKEHFTPVCVSRHKFRLTVLEAPQDNLQTCLQVAKVADIVAFVFPAKCENGEEYIDRSGKIILSMLRAQGLPTTVGIVLGLDEVPIKKRSEVRKLCIERVESEFPSETKIYNGDTTEESQQILRHIVEKRPSHLHWRSQRPYVIAEQLSFEQSIDTPTSGTLVVSGYVRERSISVNQLVHVSGVGDFQIEQIQVLEDPYPSLTSNDKGMGIDTVKTMLPDPDRQEPLTVENVPDTLAGEQTWPTEQELAQAEHFKNKTQKKRHLPKGTSTYQAAWIIDESDGEDGSDDDDENADMDENDEMECEEADDGPSALSEDEGTIYDDEQETSDMMDDENLTMEQQREEIKRLKDAVRNDEEFPDEVDTPMDMPARQRFARYRGLKSFRTSEWDPKESLPPDYARIFAFDNFNRTMKHVIAKSDDADLAFQVEVGKYVKLRIKNFPSKNGAVLLESYQTCPVVACGLLQHEFKMSVLHFSIKKHDSYTEPIKSKDALVFHTGFRSYVTRPIFSTDDNNMNKHKYERFLHPGRFSVASAFLPVQFPPVPLIVFKSGEKDMHFVASGSLRNTDPDRIILKKIILSGYPLKVTKRKAIVRYMFHNPEDVRWFKPLELWTKYGRRGRIMEPVGTHGAMKCVFDGVVQQRDAVCVNLYKRVYPKWPETSKQTTSRFPSG